MFSFEFVCFVLCLFCCYMCLFDCKCNNLKRLGENNKHRKKQNKQQKNSKESISTKHKYRISSPRTSANKSHKLFAEVRGLDILYFCSFCFSSSFYVVVVVMFLSVFAVFA